MSYCCPLSSLNPTTFERNSFLTITLPYLTLLCPSISPFCITPSHSSTPFSSQSNLSSDTSHGKPCTLPPLRLKWLTYWTAHSASSTPWSPETSNSSRYKYLIIWCTIKSSDTPSNYLIHQLFEVQWLVYCHPQSCSLRNNIPVGP